jgi:hypothetical protein
VPVTILEDSKDIKYADFVDVYKARHLSIMVEPFDALKITKLTSHKPLSSDVCSCPNNHLKC